MGQLVIGALSLMEDAMYRAWSLLKPRRNLSDEREIGWVHESRWLVEGIN